jgi:ParB-like chromosome segregation protein Spo0J
MIENPPTETQVLPLKRIRLDDQLQSRVELSEEVIQEYQEIAARCDGRRLPPVTVFFDGKTYRLADGWHRYHAHKRAKDDSIAAVVKPGGFREALLWSVGANAEHGLPRTSADKRKAVTTLLQDSEWSAWSSREIARRCGVSEGLVRSVRDELSAHETQMEQPQGRLVRRGDQVYTISAPAAAKPKTARPADEPETEAPHRDQGESPPEATIPRDTELPAPESPAAGAGQYAGLTPGQHAEAAEQQLHQVVLHAHGAKLTDDELTRLESLTAEILTLFEHAGRRVNP